jgi:adenylate cyclase
VIGYEVSEPLLRAIAGLPDSELNDALLSLVSDELLSEHFGEAGVEYAFKHPLTQEVAYRSQLSERRKLVHREVAIAIEQLYSEKLDELAALVAQHWESGDDALAAARWNARAAAWVGLSDISQALANWRKVGDLTQALPDSSETTALSLLAHVRQLDYGWRLGITEQEAAAHYHAGRELAERSGDPTNLLLITGFYASVRGLAGHVREYAELGQEVNRLSLEIGDPALRMAMLSVPIFSRYLRGSLGEALALAEEGITLGAEDPALGDGIALVCPYAYCLMMKGLILCYRGQLEESGSNFGRALQVAEEQGDLETQGWTHMFCVLLARYTGQTEAALAHATQAYEIAERIGSALSRVWSLYFLGYARLILGETGEAIAFIERSIELARDCRTGLEVEPQLVAGLSEALLSAGDHPRAREAADESVALAVQRGNATILPTSYRVLAEALLASEDPDDVAEAEEALDKATAAVQATGARAELPSIERVRQKLIPVS